MKPFVRWAGGKTKLLPEIEKLLPPVIEHYYEPFVGGGALFFYLSSRHKMRSVLTDLNDELVKTYLAVRDDVEHVIVGLEDLQAEAKDEGLEQTFYRVRSLHPHGMMHYEVTIRFLWLNKLCFNGLYRVNRKGIFNSPLDNTKKAATFEFDNLRACSKALRRTWIECCSFTDASAVLDNSVVYFDPPYVPVARDSFTSYQKEGFTHDDQVLLRDVALDYRDRGATVILSNSWCDEVLEIYADLPKCDLFEVQAPRRINSDPTKRGKVSEALIRLRCVS